MRQHQRTQQSSDFCCRVSSFNFSFRKPVTFSWSSQ